MNFNLKKMELPATPTAKTKAKTKTKKAKVIAKTKAKAQPKPFYTWRAEYWTDGPARIGSDYFRNLEDMFKIVDPKNFINAKIDLASLPCKRIEVTIIENMGARSNNQICSAFNVTVAAVGTGNNNKINLFHFYSDEKLRNALKPFQKELEKHRASFKRLFRLNQMVEMRN